jgi:hypothetical protein
MFTADISDVVVIFDINPTRYILSTKISWKIIVKMNLQYSWLSHSYIDDCQNFLNWKNNWFFVLLSFFLIKPKTNKFICSMITLLMRNT